MTPMPLVRSLITPVAFAVLFVGHLRAADDAPFLIVLGIAQDAGFPQAGCQKPCCRIVQDAPTEKRLPACLGIVDPKTKQRWLVECTPAFGTQLRRLDRVCKFDRSDPTRPLDGILLTHGHIGHYAGLIHLGREVMGARHTPVFCMPRMRAFLRNNGPWSQLVKLNNIRLQPLAAEQTTKLNERISVRPFLVPHRDEFTETVAFHIQGPRRSALFLPDIDKWERWKTPVESVLKTVDVAYLDATFFDGNELPGRNMDDIPHPFAVESMRRFAKLPATERAKIRFLHLNHTNPLLQIRSPQAEQVRNAGMQVAAEGERVSL